MQKFFSLLLALIACAGTMFADYVQIGDLYYNLNAEDLTAEVTYQEQWSPTNYFYLTTVNIPESVEYNSVTYSVTSIGDHAFAYCSGLTSIEIPNSVTSIGNNAFIYCSGLTSIVVASGNTTYDSRENCNAIIETASNTLIAGCKNTIIPNSVTSIGEYAFVDCSGLTCVTNYATTPQTINSYVFDGVNKSSCTLYVPEGSINLYQAANGWRDFTNIQAIAETQSIGEVTNNQSRITNIIIKDNQIYILTGDKTYTLTGQQLK